MKQILRKEIATVAEAPQFISPAGYNDKPTVTARREERTTRQSRFENLRPKSEFMPRMGYSQISDAGDFDDFIFPLYDIGEDSRHLTPI